VKEFQNRSQTSSLNRVLNAGTLSGSRRKVTEEEVADISFTSFAVAIESAFSQSSPFLSQPP